MNSGAFICLLIPIIAGTASSWKKVKDNKLTKKAFYTNTLIAAGLCVVAFLLLTDKIKL